MQPSSSSWERRRWPSAAPSGPSWPLHTWTGQGPAGPGPATSGASVGSLGLAPRCNFTHFRFDRSLTPPFACDCAHTFVNISAIKTNSRSILTQTFRDCSHPKINWFPGVPNSMGGVGQCLMNGVPGVDGVQLGTILGQNSLLISGRSGEKLWWTARSCETTLERGGDGGQLRLSKTMVSCGIFSILYFGGVVGVQLNPKTSKLFSLSKSMTHASYLMTHAMSKLPITNRSSNVLFGKLCKW